MSTNWQTTFQDHGAIWIHDGKKARPHALLTSGLHSDGFVNCTLVTQHASLLQQIVSSPEGLAPKLPAEKVDWVIGSAYGAVTFAYAVALQLKAKTGFTEKDGEAMKLSRFEIGKNETVLVVEDTISTGGSTLKTIEGILKSGVPADNILPYIVCLVNRSGSDQLAGRALRPLIKTDIHTWQPAECPLCKAGSQAVRPKSHWRELTAQYS
ncbi:MAG TPA: phosphoribosyltransferase family protein [Planctomycetota bacterium]|nr:phosphoribosyltransferase family protein [Planctomycetota bacterium]